jgi:hypothetical protein
VRGVFVREGAVLSAVGVALGLGGAVGYAALIMYGLGTWWVDAVGTTALTLHLSPPALVTGALGTGLAALAALWTSTRALARRSPRLLLLGGYADAVSGSVRVSTTAGLAGIAVAVLLMAATRAGWVPAVAGFFGAGGLLLAAGLSLARARLLQRQTRDAANRAPLARLWTLGQSHAAWRPTRTVLTSPWRRPRAPVALPCWRNRPSR